MYGQSAAVNALTQMGSAFAQKSEGRKIRRDSAKLQREFAQNGLSWKIADAYKNKDLIHPLVSMGANVMSASPSNVGVPDKVTSNFQPGDFSKKKTTELETEQIRGVRLQNDILEIEKNKLISGSGDPNVVEQPALQTKKTGPDTAAGDPAFFQWSRRGQHAIPIINKDISDNLESDTAASIGNSLDKLFTAAKQFTMPKSKATIKNIKRMMKTLPPPRKGYKWLWDWNKQAPIEVLIKNYKNHSLYYQKWLNKTKKPYKRTNRSHVGNNLFKLN